MEWRGEEADIALAHRTPLVIRDPVGCLGVFSRALTRSRFTHTKDRGWCGGFVLFLNDVVDSGSQTSHAYGAETKYLGVSSG